MIEILCFLVGSLVGCAVTCFFAAVIHTRKAEEMHDELISTRETIRRNAYARGYECAKKGEVKRA